ncbi:MAG: sulfite exporter TauE/SafE family protein [Bacteriovoracales bacterium]|nr:sulfite exporter TauE/SafE family protein [Bacteriovoracales bacterium]
MTFIILVTVGFGTGFISSLLGIGGGFFIIEASARLFPSLPPQTIAGSSLFFIFINSFVNVSNFWKRGLRPNWAILGPMIPLNLSGAVMGGLLTQSLQKETIRLLFATILVPAALGMLWGPLKSKDRGNDEGPLTPLIKWKASLSGMIAGFTGGISGLGGGGIIAPLLIKIVKTPPKRVPLYSNCIIFTGTLSGSLTFFFMKTPWISNDHLRPFQFGQVNLGLSVLALFGSFISSPLGVSASQKIPIEPLLKLLAILFLATALQIYWKTFN